MNPSLRQILVNVLATLKNHAPEEIADLYRLMEGTTLEPYRDNVVKALGFYEYSTRWPEFGIISDGLADLLPDPKKSGVDVLTQLGFDLQEEFFQTEALSAANRGDWDLLESLVYKRTQLSSKSFIPYTQDHAFEEYEVMESSPSGVFLGVAELDSILRGISFKSTCVLAAPPSHFKTTSAISAAFYNSYLHEFNVLYVTMEVPKRNVWFQVLSRLSGEGGERFIAEDVKKVLLDEKGKQRFKELKDQWKAQAKGSLHVADQGDLGDGSYKSLLNMLNSVNRQVEKGTIDIVFWDYIQLFKYFRMSHQTELEYLNGLVRYTDSLCKSYQQKGFVNIILSQVNRQGTAKIEKSSNADLGVLADMNELDRSANSVVVFYSDAAMRLNNQLNAQIVKHRDGKVMEEMVPIFVDPEISQVGLGEEKCTLEIADLDLLGSDMDANLFV